MNKTFYTDVIEIGDLRFAKYIESRAIEEKVREIADSIREDYHDKNPLFLVVMNGAFIFAADLIRKLQFPCELTFIRISSYHKTESTGQVQMYFPPGIEFTGRHIVIIEDIIDTGNTMAAFLPELEKFKPASIKIAAILVKQDAHLHPIETHYPGFIIPTKFVVGYGLDYEGLGRNLPDLYQLFQSSDSFQEAEH